MYHFLAIEVGGFSDIGSPWKIGYAVGNSNLDYLKWPLGFASDDLELQRGP